MDHILLGGSFNQTLRQWQSIDSFVSPANFILPIFIVVDDDCLEEIPSLPNVCRFGLNKLKAFLEPAVQNGLKCVLLFGVVQDDKLKDENASLADSPQSGVIRGIGKIREWFPQLLIACDVCLCAYTSHGHCGIFNKSSTDPTPSANPLIENCLNRE